MPLPKILSQGQGPVSVSWQPTVVYLLVLVLAEMVAFGLIAKMLR